MFARHDDIATTVGLARDDGDLRNGGFRIRVEQPGKNPGTSTNVTTGILKQSQKRINRAAFTAALISKQPARFAGWLATMPTERPPR